MKPQQDHREPDKNGEAEADPVPKGVNSLLKKGKVPGNVRVIRSVQKNEHEKHLQSKMKSESMPFTHGCYYPRATPRRSNQAEPGESMKEEGQQYETVPPPFAIFWIVKYSWISVSITEYRCFTQNIENCKMRQMCFARSSLNATQKEVSRQRNDGSGWG